MSGPVAANWLGESLFASGKYAEAIAAYQTVSRWPGNKYIPQALYSVGFCQFPGFSSNFHASIDQPDLTISDANAALSWGLTSGPSGSIVDRYQIDKFTDLMRPLGLKEVSRTGVLSIQRGVEVL